MAQAFRIFMDDSYSDTRSRDRDNYYDFYGAIGGTDEKLAALRDKLEDMFEEFGWSRELKWSKREMVRDDTRLAAVMGVFFDALRNGDIFYRGVCYSAQQNIKPWLKETFGETNGSVAHEHHYNEHMHAATVVALNAFRREIERGHPQEYSHVEIQADEMGDGLWQPFKMVLNERMAEFEAETGAQVYYRPADSKNHPVLQLTDFVTGFMAYYINKRGLSCDNAYESYVYEQMMDFVDLYPDFSSPESLTECFSGFQGPGGKRARPSFRIECLDRRLDGDFHMARNRVAAQAKIEQQGAPKLDVV